MPNPKSEDWLEHLRKSISKTFQNLSTEVYDLFDERPSYINMILPVNKITKELEESLKTKIEHNILHAQVREAFIEDIETIYDIYNQAWHSSPMPFRQVKKETFLKILEQPNTLFLIAKIGSKDGGFILIHFEGEKNEFGVINGLAILPKFQHKGLATTLAMATWNYFKNRNVKELRCQIHKDNNIIYSFIKSLGFEELI